MKKAWHVVKEPRFQYFLVDIHPPKQNSNKIQISYNGERYLVNQQQLLPYSDNQPHKISQLQQVNDVEIMEYLNRQFDRMNFWIKINRKLVIDFNNNTDTQREQFIKFILGRFLITQKKRQYLCVSNHQSMRNKNGTMIKTIGNVIKGISNLWRYRISLDDLSQVYGIFFRDIPMKLKIYVKNGGIIKLSMTPYNLFSINLLGTAGTEGLINLKGRIFNVMANSKRQIKNYYRVPYYSITTQSQSEDLQTLTNYLMHVGLTVSEIKSILQTYSLIMTINCLQVVKSRKEDRSPYKIREGSITKTNLHYLIGEDLTNMLEDELNSQENIQPNKSNIGLKQQLLMLIIYQQITLKMAQILKQKMCNTSQTLQNYQQFILIEFPPTNKQQQKTAQQYLMELVNNKIECMGFDIPFNKKTYDFKVDAVNEVIKQQYRYDINKQILGMMQKSIELMKKLKGCKFMANLRKGKLNWINNQEIKYRQGKVDDLFEELSNIPTNQYYQNYIIQTSVCPNELPLELNLIGKIQENIQLQRQKSMKQSGSADSGDLIDVSLKKFKDTYGYCPSVKKLFKPSTNSIENKVDEYFKQNKNNGIMKDNGQKICISLPFYERLQKQRETVELKINKIKNMMKTIKFRVSILSNLSNNSKKIRAIHLICKNIYPQMRQAFKLMRHRTAYVKLQQHVNKRSQIIQKVCLQIIKKRSSIQLMNKVLAKKQILKEKKILFMKNIKKILKRERCKELCPKIQKLMTRKKMDNKRQAFTKLNREYNIVVNPPPVPSNQTQRIPANVEQNNTVNINPTSPPIINQNKTQAPPPPPPPLPKQPQKQLKQTKTLSNNTMNISSPPPELPRIPQQNQVGSKLQEQSNSPEQNQLVDQQSNQNHNSQSNYSSTNRGIQKSETSRKITQPQLFSLDDRPKFTFQIWCKQAIGFQNRKPAQPEQNVTAKILFNKPQGEKQVHKETNEQLNVDLLIKEKIVVNPFFPYLMTNIQAKNQQEIQSLMSHQQKGIKLPLMREYPKTKYPNTAMETFNNILKIGLDKNTSKSISQLINMVVKPIRDTYQSERNNISSVFDGEPAIIADYTWDHNLIKDQIFIQFIKQVMMNHNEQSLQSLSSSLQIITRYYYPSPKFIYCFLHFLKSLQSKNIQKLNDCFINTLLFAQAYERYKGNNVTAIKDQIIPREKESYPQLEPRFTLITEKQLGPCLKIQLRLINDQVFQFKVRNETLSHFKRKMLNNINMLHYEQYFGVYYCYEGKSTHCLMRQQKKAIDFLNEYPQKITEHLLYVKLKYYFPFNIKQVNKTRLMYLNSITEERNLPWAGKEYEKCVVLSMMFDQFEEYRISNYMILTNQIKSNIELTSIQQRYTEMANQRGKKICQIQYFKLLKENGFLAAKAYRVKEQHIQSSLYKVTIILIKPLQLCLYCGTDQKSSIDLHRIKGYAFQKGQIYLELDFVDQQGHLGMRTLTLKNIDRIHQFYIDLSTYVAYINDF